MKKSVFLSRLISSVFITAVLLYFMKTTTSSKVIFLPFIICGISMVGYNIALLLNSERVLSVFQAIFSAGFLLYWFGFLSFAAYLCIRDKNYSMLMFTVPFWLPGIYVAKNRLLHNNSNEKGKTNVELKFSFPIIISALLVIAALLTGIIILILGIMDSSIGLIFAGIFFVFVALVFVLSAIKIWR